MSITKEQFNQIKIGKVEKLAYGMSNFGGNLVYATISSFATLFYTDSVGIAAATVGTMMLVARVFDALSDVIMGGIIDKTHRKSGQAKPWFIWSLIPLVLSLVFVFALQAAWNETVKIIYMYITYIWSAVFCFTANSLAAVAMQSLMTGESKERMGLNASSQIMGFISIIAVNMVTSNLAAKIGWLKLSVLYAFIATIMLLITAVFCKERKHLIGDVERSEKKVQKITLREGFPILIKNRYTMIILVLSILNYITVGTFNGGGVYYATYIYHEPGLFGLMTLAGMFPTIILSSMIPYLGNRFGKRNVLMAGFLLQGVGYGLIQLWGTIFSVMICGLIIKGVALAGVAGLLIPMIGDVIEYGEMCTGKRLVGLTNSVSTCGLKVGTGIGSALVGWMLAWGGYIAGASSQSESSMFSMKLLVGGIPAICGIAGFIIAFFFDIETKLKEKKLL